VILLDSHVLLWVLTGRRPLGPKAMLAMNHRRISDATV
jgi:PIN domain nuclease of toxin-antitoxin system